MKDKLIQESTLYEGRILKLKKQIIETADGRITTREIIDHPDIVCIIAVTNDEKILLVKQYRSVIARDLIELPAGFVDKGETPQESAERELREETGYKANHIFYATTIFSSPGFTNEQIHFFIATDLTLDPLIAEDTALITLTLLDANDIVDFIQTAKINDGKTLSGLLIAKTYLEGLKK
jgi:ADP-ribose pyrophosphatase